MDSLLVVVDEEFVASREHQKADEVLWTERQPGNTLKLPGWHPWDS